MATPKDHNQENDQKKDQKKDQNMKLLSVVLYSFFREHQKHNVFLEDSIVKYAIELPPRGTRKDRQGKHLWKQKSILKN